jgi:hypothetical protein
MDRSLSFVRLAGSVSISNSFQDRRSAAPTECCRALRIQRLDNHPISSAFARERLCSVYGSRRGSIGKGVGGRQRIYKTNDFKSAANFSRARVDL